MTKDNRINKRNAFSISSDLVSYYVLKLSRNLIRKHGRVFVASSFSKQLCENIKKFKEVGL